MNKKLGLLGLVLILAAALLIRIPVEREGGTTFTGLLTSERVKAYPIRVDVVERENRSIGIALQDYELDFGILSQGMVARKSISLESYSGPAKVRVWAHGNVSGMTGFSKPELVLDGQDSVEVVMNATEMGSYEGNVYISSRSYNLALLRWLTPWL